jgi:LCCL domain
VRALAVAGFAAALLVFLAQASPASPSALSPQSVRDDPGGSTWNATAAAFRGKNGSRYVYTCPSYGTVSSVWGTDVYTDDSSVCTAAVHASLITLAGGGTVTIEIRPGQASYVSSTRNGITSSAYGPWSGSYVIVSAVAATPGIGVGGSTWDARPSAFRPYVGARFSYTCPANGTPGPVWGTDVYTDDSSVCTAAVHAGLITVAGGGSVIIEMRAGQSSYTGSTRNGITSSPYAAWGGSFVLPAATGGGTIGGPDPLPPPKPGVAVNVQGANGTVLVKVPGQSFATLQGGAQIPVGSTVDVTKGSVDLTSADGAANFTKGVFVIREPAAPAATRVTDLTLTGGNFAVCNKSVRRNASRTATPNKKVVRRLWGNGKGRFRTTGRFAAATVRGTAWRIEDRCDGTVVSVTTGTVSVRDLRLKRNVVVTAGHSYLAKR